MPYIVSVLFFFIISCSSNNNQPVGDNTPPPPQEKAICKEKITQAEDDFTINYRLIQQQLECDGLAGWVHGSVNKQSLFVFTWRHPNNFFVNLQLPMTSKNSETMKKIREMKRHDFLTIRGEFINNSAPIQHIDVQEIVEIKKWDGLGSDQEYQHETSIPNDVLENTSMIAKVHAIANEGSVVVVEFGDIVLPVINPQPTLSKDLWRNDKINLKYKVVNVSAEVQHLMVDVQAEEPIKVLEATVTGHGEPIELEGPLVMFPQSPQIRFNVYALRTEDEDNIKRNHTLVNFQDFDLFMALRNKLEEAWNSKSETAEYDRNKFINRKITVKVKGTKNVVDANQANPQVFINSLDDLEILIEE